MLGNKIVAAVGPSNVIQGSLNQGNALFGETPRIQCACMALFAISYSTIKKMKIWDQSDLDVVLVNWDEGKHY